MYEEFKSTMTMDEALEPEKTKVKQWAAFVESDIVNFFNHNQLEKMTIADGKNNKAKLVRTKDNEIKVEYTSSIIL